ncbi:MAG: S1C family serine protease [Phycisphaerales bacterium]
MRQWAPEGFVLARVGELGSLLDHRDRVLGVFGKELARGKLLQRDQGGAVAIEWDLDGFGPADLDDPDARSALGRLLEACGRAKWAAAEIDALMKRSSRAAIDLGPELAQSLGVEVRGRTARVAVTELRSLRDALFGTASGVAGAIKRGDVVVRDGRIRVFGWAFIPFGAVGFDDPVGPWATLEAALEPDRDALGYVLFRWAAGGGGYSIDLAEFRPDGTRDFGLVEQISVDPQSGSWRVPSNSLDLESEFVAVVDAPGGRVYSAPVRVPRIESPPPEPMPPVVESDDGRSLAEAMQVPVVETEVERVIGESRVRAEARRSRLRPWHAALALVAMLLLLAWLIFPLPSRGSRRVAPIVAEHLPRSTSEQRPDLQWVRVEEDSGLLPSDDPVGEPPSRLVLEAEDERVFIRRDDRVYLVVNNPRKMVYVGPAQGFFPPQQVMPATRLPSVDAPFPSGRSVVDARDANADGTVFFDPGLDSEFATGELDPNDVPSMDMIDAEVAVGDGDVELSAADGDRVGDETGGIAEAGLAGGSDAMITTEAQDPTVGNIGGIEPSDSSDGAASDSGGSAPDGNSPAGEMSRDSGSESSSNTPGSGDTESSRAQKDAEDDAVTLDRFATGVCWISAVIDDSSISSGSGFMVSASGDVMTSSHVVAGARTITVRFSGADRALNAVVIANNVRNDVALLRVKGASRPDLGSRWVFRPSASGPIVGEVVWAIGYPEFGLTVTSGVVSSVRRFADFPQAYRDEWRFSPESRWIQSDCAMNHGNSGGPLVDRRGRVLGVVTWGATRVDSAGFALDARDAFQFLGVDVEPERGTPSAGESR